MKTWLRTLRGLALAVVGFASASFALAQPGPRPDVLLADFEAPTYGDWKVEGEAFGPGPAAGALPGQMSVAGFQGKRLVNSFFQGDRTTGKLTSPAFKIERAYVNFLIGGGGHAGETCINLLVDGRVVRTAAGPNTRPGGSEDLQPAAWDVTDVHGQTAVIEIVDQATGGWGHINIDHIVLSDTKAAPTLIELSKTLDVAGTHLIVPVSDDAKPTVLGLYDGERLVQSFSVGLPQGNDAVWLAAYPLDHFGLQGKRIKIAPVDGRPAPAASVAAFERIKIGTAADGQGADDYAKAYRNQFHASTRRGWNNDPNGMVYHNGNYHLYYQHNPFGTGWGNMHWGHFESADLVHWQERPLALYQKTVGDMAFSGGGFIDFNNSAGLGQGTLFIAFTSTGRGECLAYSRDDGRTFIELPENPVIKHAGRDPKVMWYEPGKKWVMVVYDETRCAETEATPPGDDKRAANRNMAFYESHNLRQWTRTGAFTDPDRDAVYECPEMFELPLAGQPSETRWVLLGAQNRYFVGRFNGQTFVKESGPHGSTHGAFYAAQTFNDEPHGRRIQIGWLQTESYRQKFPDQLVNMAFTLPHELTLQETKEGPRLAFTPVKELDALRGDVLVEGSDLTPARANELLQACQNELTEVAIEVAEGGVKQLVINGIDATFPGARARIFTDRTVNEVFADGGLSYEVRRRPLKDFHSTLCRLTADEGTTIRSLKVYRLKSIWNNAPAASQ